MIQAVIFALLAIGFIVTGPRGLYLAWPVFCLTFAVYWAIMSRGRLQVRENGLWQYASLLCWEKIESYDWKGETDATLMIQAKTRFAFLGRGALPVSLNDKPQVDALLQERGIRRA